MKNLVFSSFFLLCLCLNAQSLTKSDFKHTDWFSNNDNRSFYESDTVRLIRITKFNNDNDRLNALYIKLQKNDGKDITKLKFKKAGGLEVEDLNVKNWSSSKYVGKWKWKFDQKNQILELFFNEKLVTPFKVVSTEIDSIIWKFGYKEKKTESELELSIVTLARKKK